MSLRSLAYWTATVFIALELLAGGATDLAHGREMLVFGDPVVVVLARLGYPAYLLAILGCWKILGGITLLAPGLPRLKEWAYAGAFFELTGAAVSHAVAGAGVADGIVPFVMALCALASWALRPPGRTLGTPALTPRFKSRLTALPRREKRA